MTEEKQYEEKDEKELQKHDEKVEGHDRLSSLAWAFILIWAGLVFLAVNQGWISRLGLVVNTDLAFGSLPDLHNIGVWNLIAVGAGVILLIEAIVRLLIPDYRYHAGGNLIAGTVLILLGLGGWWNWSYVWPLVLIAVGINVLISGLFRRHQ
jgi:hypothetical protein